MQCWGDLKERTTGVPHTLTDEPLSDAERLRLVWLQFERREAMQDIAAIDRVISLMTRPTLG